MRHLPAYGSRAVLKMQEGWLVKNSETQQIGTVGKRTSNRTNKQLSKQASDKAGIAVLFPKFAFCLKQLRGSFMPCPQFAPGPHGIIPSSFITWHKQFPPQLVPLYWSQDPRHICGTLWTVCFSSLPSSQSPSLFFAFSTTEAGTYDLPQKSKLKIQKQIKPVI